MTASKKRVLFDCEKVRYPDTGVFYYCMQLGEALLKQTDASKEELFFYTPSRNPTPFGSSAHYFRQRSFHKYFNPISNQVDVWHCNFQTSNYLPGGSRARVILTIHDLNFLIESSDTGEIARWKHKLQKRIDRADVIICISEFTRAMVLEHMHAAGKRIEVVYNGAKVQQFEGFDQPAFRPRRPFLFSIGTLFPKKNFHLLPALLTANDYDLVIAGMKRDDYMRVILRETEKCGMHERVHILGPINEQDKYWYYKNCTAFVFPSAAEGFGLPAVEAMSFGKPVFLSRHTSLPEIGGDAAFYFQSLDPESMRHALSEGLSSFNPGMANAAVLRAAQFNWDKAAQDYWKIYRQLY